MKLIIDIDEELHEAYKGRPPRLGDEGMDMIAQAISNGTPITDGDFLLTLMQSVMTPKQLKEVLQIMKETPQGEWIRTGSLGNGNAHYECSNCHYGDEHAESQEVPYCWHCGAKMRGEKK